MQEVGLYDYRNRVYSADLGRFLQTDPMGFTAGDVNVYRYVKNDVVDLRDTSGEGWKQQAVSALMALIAAGNNGYAWCTNNLKDVGNNIPDETTQLIQDFKGDWQDIEDLQWPPEYPPPEAW